MNQFAPDYFQGLALDPNASFEPKPFQYVYNPPNNVLGANQEIDGASVSIHTDADFYLYAVYLSLYTGPFQFRLADSTGYQLDSGMINSGAYSQSSNQPTVKSPAHLFPAGSDIFLDIEDLSGAPNPLQIVFVGVKMYKIAGRSPRQ
jgi:hypothetical protein